MDDAKPRTCVANGPLPSFVDAELQNAAVAFKSGIQARHPTYFRRISSRLGMTMNIEVERKFLVQDLVGFEQRLKSHGAAFIGEICFRDVYYDSAAFNLTLADRWLRQRDSNWCVICLVVLNDHHFSIETRYSPGS